MFGEQTCHSPFCTEIDAGAAQFTLELMQELLYLHF
jgi:hypothetical protein